MSNLYTGDNDLLTWCNNNGERGEVLKREWDTEKNREELGIEIEDVTAGSRKYVYWKCPDCNRSNLRMIYHRTSSTRPCKCNMKSGTSFPEQVIYRALRQIYSDTENRAKLFGNVEYDIYIPSEKMCIEYSGAYWHENRKEKDQQKKELCEENHMRFLQIYGNGKTQPMELSEEIISYGISYTKHLEQLKKIIQYILKMLGHKVEEVDFDKVLDDVYHFMYQKAENNIADNYPDLIKEWDTERNNNKKPESFTKGSRERINWKCAHCGNRWNVSIKSRIRFQSGCRKCGYNVFDGKIHSMARNKPKVSLQLGRYSL